MVWKKKKVETKKEQPDKPPKPPVDEDNKKKMNYHTSLDFVAHPDISFQIHKIVHEAYLKKQLRFLSVPQLAPEETYLDSEVKKQIDHEREENNKKVDKTLLDLDSSIMEDVLNEN